MSNQVFANQNTQYPINTSFVGADDANFKKVFGITGIFNNITINDLQQDNALDKVVVWDFNTSELKYSTAIGATGAQGPTGPASGITGPTGAQGPTGISVNTTGYIELPLGITVTLTNPMPNFINITAGGAGFNINLPQMDLPNSLQAGPIGSFFIYKNHAGSQITIVMDFIGGTVATLYPGKIYMFQVASNATPQGTFIFKELTDVVSATSPLNLNPTTGELSIDLSNYCDLTSPQDLLEKQFNDTFGRGFGIYSNTGANRFIKFNVGLASDNTTTTLRATQTANRTITLPNNSGTVALLSDLIPGATGPTGAQGIQGPTGTNNLSAGVTGNVIKYLSANTIGDSLLPISSIVDLSSGQTLQNKNMVDVLTKIVDQADPTKYFYVDVGGNPGTFTALVTTQTGTRLILTPDISGTLIVDVGNQTLQQKTIANLTATGTTQSLLSGKQVTSYFTATTTTNTPTTIFTEALAAGDSLTLEIDATAFCTASGAGDLDKVRGFSSVYLIKRTSLGVMSNFTISSAIAGDGGFAPTVSISLGPGTYSLVCTGVTGDTIIFGGNYCKNYR